MLMSTVSAIAQVAVRIGLLNVWLLRPGKATSYCGGHSRTLKAEFAA